MKPSRRNDTRLRLSEHLQFSPIDPDATLAQLASAPFGGYTWLEPSAPGSFVQGKDETVVTIAREATQTVDLRGLRCPHLGRRVRKALAHAGPGDFLDFVCNDPLAAIDIPHLVGNLGYKVVGTTTERDGVRICVWKVEQPNLPRVSQVAYR